MRFSQFACLYASRMSQKVVDRFIFDEMFYVDGMWHI